MLRRWLNARVNSGQYTAFSALHFAVQSCNFDLFLLLVSAGAEMKSCLAAGVSCLHLAAQSNNVKTVHYLLSQGVLPVDWLDNNGCTPLHWACLEGSYEVVKYLLAEKANANAVTLEARSTPLHIAI